MILSVSDVCWKKIEFVFQYSLNFDEQKITVRDSAVQMIEKVLSTSPFSGPFGGKAAGESAQYSLGAFLNK